MVVWLSIACHAFAGEPGIPESELLAANDPYLHKDLQQYATVCFRTPVEAHTAAIEVSVVGLIGNPTVVGDWEPQVPSNDQKNYGGFAMWHTPEMSDKPSRAVSIPNGKQDYFTCVTTYSEQGCDFLITVYVDLDGKKPDTMVQANLPSIWQLASSLRRFRLIDHGWNANLPLEVLLTPLEGEAQLSVVDCATGAEVVASALDGPDWVVVERNDLCLVVSGTAGALVAVEVSQGLRTLAQSMSLALMIKKGETCSAPFQMFVNNKFDVGLTVTSAMHIFAGWKEATKLHYDWDGSDGVLNINRSDFRALETTRPIFACVCAPQPVEINAFMFCTSWSGIHTISIGEGETLTVRTERTDKRAKGKWTDFRFFIPVEVTSTRTLKATAITPSTQLILLADTVHFAHNPKAYRWKVPKPYSSEATLVFTRDPSLRTDRIHLIDCRPPCYIYVTAYAYNTLNATATTAYDISLVAEGSTSLLVDELGSEQTLGPLESQDFYYRLPSKTDPILIGVSCPEGQVRFMISNTPAFEASTEHTTGVGREAVLLDPALDLIQNAKDVLYIRILNGDTAASFVITCRIERDIVRLGNGGTPVNGVLRPNEYNHYRVEIPHPARVHIGLEALAGDPNMYVSLTDKYVGRHSATWSSQHHGSDEMDLNATSGWTGSVYIGVSSQEESAYNIIVSWGTSAETLIDGVRSRGSVLSGELRLYFMEAAGDMRLSLLNGSVTVCPKAPHATNVSSAFCQNISADGIATFAPGESQYFEVRGISAAEFYIWALISAPLTIYAGEMCRDWLEPHRTRNFQTFVVPIVSQIRVTLSLHQQADVALRARQSGDHVWPYHGKRDGHAVVLEISKRDSIYLANRWLDIMVDASTIVNYTLTVDCGPQIESQEILPNAPPFLVRTPLYSSHLFTLPPGDLHITQCLNRVRVLTGPSTDKIRTTHEATNNSRAHIKLGADEHFALIMPEVAGESSVAKLGIYEVSMNKHQVPPLSGLEFVSNVVSLPIPKHATRVRAFFARRKALGCAHLDSLCGLRALENLSGILADDVSIERIPLGAEHVAIEPPWSGAWSVNIMVDFNEGESQVFVPVSDFGANSFRSKRHIVPMTVLIVFLYFAIGFFYNAKVHRLSGFQAIPHVHYFSARTYHPSLEVPLHSLEDPYQPLVDNYRPPSLHEGGRAPMRTV